MLSFKFQCPFSLFIISTTVDYLLKFRLSTIVPIEVQEIVLIDFSSDKEMRNENKKKKKKVMVVVPHKQS